jgi:hypothetical protein
MEALVKELHRVEHIGNIGRVDQQIALPQSLPFFRAGQIGNKIRLLHRIAAERSVHH